MNIYSFTGDGLEACRVCLATDVKLYDLHKTGLVQTLFEFSGTPISSSDGLPQHICVYCYGLLKKSSSFRNKCRSSHTFLLNCLLQMHCLTTSYICSTDRSHLMLPLNVTKTEINTFLEEETNIKQELDFDTDPIQDDVYEDSSKDFNNTTDFNDIFNNTFVKSEGVAVLNNCKDKRKKKKKIKNKDTEDKVNQFKNKYLDNTIDSDKRMFYEYILEKYVKRSKNYVNRISTDNIFDRNDTIKDLNNIKTEKNLFISIDNGNITEKTTDLTDKITETYKNTENINQKRFYQYILEKYNKNSVTNDKVKKVTDVTRMRERKNKLSKRKTKTKDELANFSKTYNLEVRILNKEEQIADMMSRKETEKFCNANFKCLDCYRGFTAEKAFQNHLAIHDASTGPHVCDICHVRFDKRARMTKHIQLRHKYKFTCKMCSQVTRNSTCAREHYKCHAGFKYECEHCGKIFSKYGSRINHIRIYHGSATCEVCQETFAGETGLMAHRTKAHRELFKCTSCGVQFHNPGALKRHADSLLDNVCGAHIRPCTQCGDNFSSEELMKEHMLEYHNKQKPRGRTQSQPRNKLIEQPRPNVQWVAKRRSRPPDTNSPDTDSLTSDLTQSRTGSLLRRKVCPPQKLMCEMCAADGFASEAVLRYHQRIHTGEKPHPCPQCPKRFRIKELLQKHLRTHTGDRPYKCAHCLKAFKTASAHHTHQVVHTKIRRHQCHLCEKSFLTGSCVKTHIKSVHMKLPTPPRARQTSMDYTNDMRDF